MSPSLLPDLAHLPVLAVLVAVALVSIGIGVWVGARSAETALIAGWGVAGAATVVVGTATAVPLSWVMLLLGGTGIAGLGRIIAGMVRAHPVMQLGMAGRVGLLALPLACGIESMDATGWDDFSHWLPNLAYLCIHNHFPTLAEPSASIHPAYPYGLALPGYAYFLLLGSVRDNAAIVWNLIMLVAAGAAVATLLLTRLQRSFPDLTGARALPWATAAIGLLVAGLACPSFVAKIVFSNMADGTTGAVLAVLGLLLFEWVAAIRDGDAGRRNRMALVMAFASVALIDLRQANAALLAWLVFGCMLAGCLRRPRFRVADLASLAIVVLLPLVIWSLWNRYAIEQMPGGQFAFLPFSDWHFAEFPDTLRNIVHVMLTKGGLFALILLISIRAVLTFRTRDALDAPSRVVLVSSAVVSLGNIAFLTFTYLAADFSVSEARAAATFWRYAGETGPLAVVGFVAAMPLAWLRRVPMVPATVALVGVTLIAPIAAVGLYRYDLVSPIPVLRHASEVTVADVPPAAPIQIVDMTGNGFGALVVAYQIAAADYARGSPPRKTTITSRTAGIPPQDAAKIELTGAPYLWLVEGAPEMDHLFGVRLSAGCSYLLQRQAAGFSIVAGWPFSRFMRNDQRTGWSSASGAPCTS
jgi:hypothetical protein